MKITKEQLEELYIDQNLLRVEVAKQLGISESYLKSLLRKFKIKKDRNMLVLNIQKSCMAKFGLKNGGGRPDVLERIKATNRKKFGCDWGLSTKEVQQKRLDTLAKEGITNVFQREDVKEKSKQTCLERYGYTSSMQSREIINKGLDTKRKNCTFNTSSDEVKILAFLRERYEEVKCQYRSEKYPFACDFYIPEVDLYIEFQGHWTHGKRPYLGTLEDIEKVNLWKKRNTVYYTAAIDTWTRRDVIKRKTAADNKLNWLEFFTLSDFLHYFK